MISAERFSRRSLTWAKLVPSLDQYIRWANTHLDNLALPLSAARSAERSALVSEAAFQGFVEGHSRVKASDQQFAHALLSRLPGGRLGSSRLNAVERGDAQAILQRLRNYVQSKPNQTVFRPRFSGCGIVDEAQGDFMTGQELVEVKSVARSLRGTDLCQILTYAALAHAAKDRDDFELLTILNPRAGHKFSFDPSEFALDVGAPSWVDLVDRIVGEMSDTSPSL